MGKMKLEIEVGDGVFRGEVVLWSMEVKVKVMKVILGISHFTKRHQMPFFPPTFFGHKPSGPSSLLPFVLGPKSDVVLGSSCIIHCLITQPRCLG